MHSAAYRPEQSWLSWFFRGLLILGALIIFARLAELQIIKGAYFRSLAEGNRIRHVPIVAARGKILDKNGIVIVDNIPVKKTAKFDPLNGYSKVETEDAPEDEIITEWKRNYVYGGVFGHITGYINEVNADEVNKVDVACPEKGSRPLGSSVGRVGLEQYYDCALRGIDGEELVEVDTVGNRIRTLGRRQPIDGQDIKTTLDYKLQRKISELMSGKNGSVVVSSPNGDIYALYSSPSYDPNLFINQDNSAIADLLVDKNLPMFNRSIAGTYHPGSIYKIVTATAAINEGEIDESYTYVDTGVITIDEFEYKNWYLTQYGGTEGEINVVRAFARSTDTFFYDVGEKLGAQRLSDWSKKFGLSSLTDLDLTGEVSGLVPSPEWKKAVKGERWFLGNTYHMAIGQGDLAVTPVENHRLAMSVANNGSLCTLGIARTTSCRFLDLSDKSLETIKKGMKAACDPGGTGAPFFDFEPDVACKTGTAETGREDETHAWFSVYAPLDDPKYVVTVLVEKGGEGSKVAAPIARDIMDFIFHP